MSTEKWFNEKLDKFKNDPESIYDSMLFLINEQIVIQMKRTGISKSELAKRLNVSKAYITKLLSGRINLTIKSLVNITLSIGLKPKIVLEQMQVSNLISQNIRVDKSASEWNQVLDINEALKMLHESTKKIKRKEKESEAECYPLSA